MDRPPIRLDQTVQEVLSAWPATARAFQALKTNCVGCRLARFCSLQSVAEAYRLPAEVLMHEMDRVIRDSQSQVRNDS